MQSKETIPMAGSKTGNNVPAPGAMVSPHAPGATPDWTTVPTHVGEATPSAESKFRPLTQYGSAEEDVAVFRQKPADQIQPQDFEQATASPEELRKVDPRNLTPVRPYSRVGTDPAVAAGAQTRELSSGE
jgi:hypothetical protein